MTANREFFKVGLDTASKDKHQFNTMSGLL